jgi:ankyrin repeat protein
MKNLVIGNNIANVQAILKLGIDVNAEDKKGKTVLAYALEKNLLDMACVLLEANGRTDDIELLNRSLIYAVSVRHNDAVALLRQVEGININAQDAQGKTALMHAVAKGHAVMVDKLLGDERINVNAPDAQGKTALMHAVANSNADMVKKLLDDKRIEVNAKDAQSKTAFDLLNFASAKKDAAARESNRESNIAVLELFLQKKAETTVRLYSNKATRIPDEIMAEALFNLAFRMAEALFNLAFRSDMYAIEYAKKYAKSNIDAIEYANSTLGYSLDSALSHAAEFLDSKLATPIESHSEIEITKAAMKALCGLNHSLGNGVLIASAKAGNANVVKGLIAVTRLVDVNEKDGTGYTALMHAAANGHLEIVKLLSTVDGINMEDTHAEYGDHSSPNKDTVLTIAAEKQKHEVVEFLLRHTRVTEKMVLAKGRMGVTAFSLVDFALAKNGSEILSLFLKKSANFSSNIMATVARSFWVFFRNTGSSLRRGLRRGLTSISSKVISDACYELAISSRSTAIKHAINLGFSFHFHEAIMSFAVKAGKDPEERKNSIKTLLEIEPAVGVTTLMAAVKKECFPSCQAIVGAGAKFNDAILLSALKIKSVDESFKFLELMLKTKTSEEKAVVGPEVLMAAVKKECFSSCEAIVGAGAKFNDAILLSALKIKSVDESFKFLELMLKTKTSEEKAVVGPEVLMAAVKKECLRSVKLILANEPIGLDDMLSWWDRKNPLILAARKGNLEIVEALVGKGPDLHQVSSHGFGYTALSVATAHDNLSVVEFLTAKIISEPKAVTFLKSALSAPYFQRVKASMEYELSASYKFLLSAKAMLEAGKKLDQDGLSWANKHNHKELADYLRRTLSKAAAVKIQDFVRGIQARSAAAAEGKAAAKIQAFVRGIQARSAAAAEGKAAVKIQAFVRGIQARSAAAAEGKAAVKIQAFVRGIQARSAAAAEGKAAAKIQAFVRGIQARSAVAAEGKAAVKIQAFVRGIQARSAAAAEGNASASNSSGDGFTINTSVGRAVASHLLDHSSHSSSLSGGSDTPAAEVVQGEVPTDFALGSELLNTSFNSNMLDNLDDVSSLGSIGSISSLSGSSATPSIELVQGEAATVPTLVAESSDNSSNSNSFVNVSLSN